MDTSLKMVALLYIVTLVSVVFNVVFMRQLFGFFYLSFIIGYLFLRLLKIEKLDLVRTLIFSVGISVSILMFLGFVLNEISRFLNFSTLLSTPVLIIAMSFLTLIPFLLSYKKEEEDTEPFSFGTINATTALHIIFAIGLPLVSIIGMLTQNTLITLAVIVAIPIWFAVAVFSRRFYSPKIFPLIIISASATLLFQTILISKYFMGSDIFLEFYVFKLTETSGYWIPPGAVASFSSIDALNSLLSITVLPTIFTTTTNISGEVFFKFFFPFVFSLIPLAIYKMYDEKIGKKIALLSVLFFISNPVVFYGLEPLSLTRQMLAQFFFVLFMLVLFDKKQAITKKYVLLTLFGAALIVSHYSIAFVFVFYLLLILILSRVKAIPEILRVKTQALKPAFIILLLILAFSWYIYVSEPPFTQLVGTLQRIYTYFGADFLSTQARFQPALEALSPLAPTTITGLIHKSLTYTLHFFIVVGVLALLIKPKIFKFGSELRAVSIISTTILVLAIAVPNLAPAINMTRLYSIVIPFIVPFCILGGILLLKYIEKFFSSSSSPKSRFKKIKAKNWKLGVIASLLIVTFLFNASVINYISGGYPYSYSLDLQRREASNNLSIKIETHSLYFIDQEVYGANWLRENMNPNAKVHADWNSKNTLLRSYAYLSDESLLPLSNDTIPESGDYIYLKYLNVVIGVVYIGEAAGLGTYNISDLSPVLSECDRIYSNGGSDIYWGP